MGIGYSSFQLKSTKHEWIPDSNEAPTFDPQFGFKAPRKEREIKTTVQEMDALRIPPEDRDYCVDYHRDFLICKRNYFPFAFHCLPEKHNLIHCLKNDYLLRSKEYEREKRLRMRQRKLEGKSIE